MPSKFAFKLNFKYGSKCRWRFIVQRNTAILWPMKTCTFPVEITKREFERSYSYLRLVAACSKIAQTSIEVRKTKLLPLVLLWAQKRISEQALHWPLVGSLCWDDWRTSVTTLHVCVVWAVEHFYKNKASHHKQRQFNCCFLKYNFCLRNKYNVFYWSTV